MSYGQTATAMEEVLNAAGIFTRPGTVRYVHSRLGTNGSNYGSEPEQPYATIDYAIGKCNVPAAANGHGDTIVVLPGHTEALSAAASIAVDVAGITIIGKGNGRNRPVLTWGTAITASMTVTGANTKFQNIVFDFTGFDAITAAIVVNAADVSFDNCEFITNSGTIGVVSGITVGGTTTSPRFTVTNSRFIGPATNSGTTTTAQVTITDAPDFVFENNYCTGKMTQSINNAATNLRGLIRNNAFVVATGTKAINMAAASTPFITNNRINVPSGTAPIVAAAGFVSGNNYSAAAGVTAGTASTI